MTFLADGLLIVICLTTALYCHVLSRRLRILADTKSGLGQQILQMNERLEDTRGAITETRHAAKTATEKLGKDIALGRKVSSELVARLKEVDMAVARVDEALAEIARQEVDLLPEPAESMQATQHRPEREGLGDLLQDVAGEVDDEEISSHALAPDRDDTGEIQLGFTPERDNEAPGVLAELPDDDDASASSAAQKPAVNGSKPHWSEQENLLNVERMAL